MFNHLSAMVTVGTSGRRCLHVLIVAINARWFACTKQLQLASLSLCEESRSVASLHLRNHATTPGQLLTAADTVPGGPNKQDSTRVPPFRARRVTWKRSSAVMLSRPMRAFSGLEVLKFGPDATSSVQTWAWRRPLIKTKLLRGITTRIMDAPCGQGLCGSHSSGRDSTKGIC